MKCLWCIFVVSVFPQWSSEVELSMQGTVNLGQDVVKALSRYVDLKKPSRRLLTQRFIRDQPKYMVARRFNQDQPGFDRDIPGSNRDKPGSNQSKPGSKRDKPGINQDSSGFTAEDRRFSKDKPGYIGADNIAKIVDKAGLCRNMEICQGDLGVLVNKYVTTLAEGIELVFESLVNAINNEEESNNIIIFEEELTELVIDIKQFLRSIDNNTQEFDAAEVWPNIVKKINAKFIERSIAFAEQRLEGSPNEIFEVKKKVVQKIVIVTSVIELEFENILCKKHGICIETFECTKSLVAILENLKSGPDKNIKEFIKHFSDELPATKFFTTLTDDTAKSFQKILQEMANSDNVLTKNILSVVHKSVEDRQNVLTSRYKVNDRRFGRDVKLVHIILSDMDFIFSKSKAPFHDFSSDFFYWIKEGGRFGLSMRRVMKDLQNKLSFTPDDLVNKLIVEVKVFMELTVDASS